ncbi:MAG: hypothetical protein IKR25_05570 [Muribaculaceae bacterium]|nr:hypothetical protein [Muribaculaceae bacterium]
MCQNLEEMKEPLVENGFGTAWYGNLVTILGGDWNDVYCRGSWSDLRLMSDDVLAWSDETAWGPMIEVFGLIEKTLPGLKVWYMAEEECMEIYETNDQDGIYFPERYVLRTDWDTEYDEELSQVLKVASDKLKRDITTKDELTAAIDDLDDWAFYEFKVVR